MTTIKLRRGTAAEWASGNPVLNDGEVGFERDTNKHKIGDGVTAWNGLNYFLDSAGIDTHEFGLTTVGYDLLLSCGQSNESGRGLPDLSRQDVVDPRVFQFGNPGSAPAAYTNVISAAVEPLYQADTSSGIGHAVHMARRLLHILAPNRRVLIVPCAYGGTGLGSSTHSWDPSRLPGDTTNLAAAAVIQANLAMAAAEAEYPGQNRWLGLSWCQGEADSSAGQSGYATLWDGMWVYLKANIPGLTKAVVAGMVPEWIPTQVGADTIRLAHMDTPYRVPGTAYCDGIAGDPNGTPPSVIHYGPIAQRKMGASMAEGLLRARANVSGGAPIAPRRISAIQSGFSLSASWTMPLSRVTDFLIETQKNSGSWTTFSHTRSLNPSATISGFAAGDTVKIRVSTVNEQGNSTPIVSSLITMIDLPAALASLAAGTPTSTTIPLSWAASARASSYRVEYKKTADSTWLLLGSVAGLSATAIGLSPSVSYDLRVTPVNVAGDGTVATVTTSTSAASLLSADVGVGPAGAFGLRRLVTGYSGNAVKVRRSSDSTLLDIGILSNGDLDVSTLETFCAGTDGFVTTWYDQSGNAVNATQATTTKQPQIVTGGVCFKINGKPTVRFRGTDSLDLSAVGAWAAGAHTYLAVVQPDITGANMCIAGEGNSANLIQRFMALYVSGAGTVSGQYRDDANATFLSAGGPSAGLTDGNPHQVSMIDSGTSFQGVRDGTFGTAVSYTRAGHTLTLNKSAIGGQPHSTYQFLFTGFIAELVRWSTALTTPQEAGGRANQRSWFGTS